MNSLFGVDLPTPVNFVIAFVVVLVLIGAAAWLVRRFGATRLDAAARSRQPRLAVIDAAAVDGRRKLVIIRRDNVEHLLMIGGPTDVVVETNIVRAAAAAVRETPTARNGGSETLPRAMPLPDTTPWPLQPEPAPAHAARAERSPRVVADDPWQDDAPAAPPVRAARPADTLAGLAAELSRPAPEPVATPRTVHAEPAQSATVQPAAAAASSGPVIPAADHSLAEMAQRLEAALRRPMAAKAAAEGRSTARVAVAAEAKPASPKVTVMQPKGSAQPKPQPQPQAQPQQSANLEQEMANLLGRPGKT
jgi:flagellar protein FliO/FliZ